MQPQLLGEELKGEQEGERRFGRKERREKVEWK